jgi:hypothetical protein
LLLCRFLPIIASKRIARMKIHAEIPINAPREAIWNAITDIENAASRIKTIESIEVLERPKSGLVGFKWRETRTMFGKKATEVMWITAAEPLEYYITRAESHDAIYESKLYITEEGGVNHLHWDFDGRPTKFISKLMMVLMGWMIKGATRKALTKDLKEIKAHVEGQGK